MAPLLPAFSLPLSKVNLNEQYMFLNNPSLGHKEKVVFLGTLLILKATFSTSFVLSKYTH